MRTQETSRNIFAVMRGLPFDRIRPPRAPVVGLSALCKTRMHVFTEQGVESMGSVGQTSDEDPQFYQRIESTPNRDAVYEMSIIRYYSLFFSASGISKRVYGLHYKKSRS